VFEGVAEVVRAVESPTRSAEPATRALEHGVLGPDGTGLESSLVETADEGVRPALLYETTRGAGSDSPAAGGGRGAELDPVIPTLFLKDSPVSGVAMKHRGVTPAEKEKMEYWIEGAGGGKVELHTGFPELTHCNNRPLVSDAAEEERMMLLEEVVAMFPREEAGGFPRETSESWNAESEEGKQ